VGSHRVHADLGDRFVADDRASVLRGANDACGNDAWTLPALRLYHRQQHVIAAQQSRRSS
jgi:hypothetical protein